MTGVGGASGMGTVLCLLNKKDINLITADSNPLAPPLYWTRNSFILPFASNKNYINTIIKRIKQYNIDLIIPNTSEELIPFSRNILRISKYSHVLISNQEVIDTFNDKYSTYLSLKKIEIPTAKSLLINNITQLKRKIIEMKFPIVIKPRISRGSRGFFICKNKFELLEKFKKLKKSLPFKDLHFLGNKNKQIIIQEYLPGDEYDLCLLYDYFGKMKACVIMKIYLWEQDKNIRLIKTENNSEILKLIKALNKKIIFKGPIDIEIKKDRNNKLKILEINPRMGGDVLLTEKAGCNIPLLLVDIYRKKKIRYRKYKENFILYRYNTFYTISEKEIIRRDMK